MAPSNIPAASEHLATVTQESEAASPIEVQDLEAAGVIRASPAFQVALGKTYYHNGFFNVPVKFSDQFPEHGTEISIYCGDSRGRFVFGAISDGRRSSTGVGVVL